jgi:CRISPR/Cas system-associated exonuclease Cas4 (RecB family)
MNDIVTYNVAKQDLSKWIKTRIQKLEDSITENELPSGEVSGLCKNCRYQTKCYDSGDGLITKSLSIPKK